MLKETLLAAALSLSGCSSSAAEYDAYYTPMGIVYNNGTEKDPNIVAHEETHKKRAEDMGVVVFFYRYNTDPVFACEEEAHAALAEGRSDIFNHPACDVFVYGENK